MSKKSFVNTSNAEGRPSDDKYVDVIQQIRDEGVCPFCPEYFEKFHAEPMLHKGKYWLLTKNMYPYRGAAHHMLLVHREHIEHLNQLSPEAWQELHEIINMATEKYEIRGAALLTRFGDTRHTGASVTHLHAQIISGSGDDGADAVIARVG